MTEDEKVLEGLKKSIQDEVNKVKSDLSKGLLEKADFETRINEINTQFNELKEKSVEKSITDGLQSQIDKLNQKHEALKLTGKKAESFLDSIISKAIELKASYTEKGKAIADITLKSGPLDFGLTTTTGDGIPQGDREPGINYAPKRRPVMLDVILSGATNSNVVEWVEKTDEEGAPAFKKEFETFPKRSWKSILRSLTVKKIAVFAEYSKEILEDVDFFQAELRRDLVEQIQLILDREILNGDEGAADEAGLKGILEYAQAWTNLIPGPTPELYTLPEPSIYDVIAVGVNQIEEAHHFPTVIMMRPATAMAMKLSKDKEGRYLMPPFATANGTTVEGLPVVTNTLLKPGEILIMDGTKAQFLWKRNWQLEMSDSHSDNFAKDVLAVRLTGRGVLKVKNTDAKAFVYIADVRDAITALTPSS
jgi:HK97 family phage major capsid protein